MATDRETIMTFIEAYKRHSCLWNVSNQYYMNKQKRKTALQDMIPILGETATIDTVRKKIDVLRNGYFREYKKTKVRSTESPTNDDYVPTLWYYHMMSFLTSSEEVSKPDTEDLTEDATGDTEIRRKRRSSNKIQEKFVNAKRILTTDDTNDNMFGLYLGRQLQNLTNDQRIMAEKLMSDVLYLARTNQLNENSRIKTLQHSSPTTPIPNITSPQSHTSSPSLPEQSPSNNSTDSPAPIPSVPTSSSSLQKLAETLCTGSSLSQNKKSYRIIKILDASSMQVQKSPQIFPNIQSSNTSLEEGISKGNVLRKLLDSRNKLKKK